MVGRGLAANTIRCPSSLATNDAKTSGLPSEGGVNCAAVISTSRFPVAVSYRTISMAPSGLRSVDT